MHLLSRCSKQGNFRFLPCICMFPAAVRWKLIHSTSRPDGYLQERGAGEVPCVPSTCQDLHGRAATYPTGGVTMGGYCTKMVVPALVWKC